MNNFDLKKYLAEGKIFEAEVKEYIVTKDDWKKSKFNFEGLADSEFKIKIGGEGKYQKYMLFWKEGGKKYWEWEAGHMKRQLKSALISIAKRKLPIPDTVAEGDVNEVKMSDEDVKNAYEEAYANETGKRLRTRSFDYDKVTKKTVRKEVIIIKNLISDGEELGDVTLVNSGDGYNIGY